MNERMGNARAPEPGADDIEIIEIIIEPDVVPRGTVDLKSLVGGARADGRARETPSARGRREAILTRTHEPKVPVAPVVPPAASGRFREPALVAGSALIAPVTTSIGGNQDGSPRVPAPIRDDAADPALPALPPASESSAAARTGLLQKPDPSASPLPELAPEPESPTLTMVEAAAKAPMPPRPEAAAHHAAPADAAIPDDYAPASLGEVSAFSTLAKLLAQLLALFLFLLALCLHLMGWAPWQKQPDQGTPAAIIAGDPTPPRPTTSESVPVTPSTSEVAPPPVTEPEPAPEPAPATEAPAPKPLEPVEPEALEAEGEVGLEEDDADSQLMEQLEALRAQAANFIKTGKLNEAQAALEELLKLSPEDSDAMFRLGLVFHKKGDLEQAIVRYTDASARAPRDARPLNNLGLIQTARGQRDAAKETFNRALQASPEDPDVLSNLAMLLEAAAPTQASPLYDKALERDPRHGPARLGRARVRAALGDRQGARADYQALVDQDVTHAPRALDGMGVLSRLEGKPADAAVLHRRALEKQPGFGEARVNLGVALLDAKQNEEALKELEAATKALPRSARAWQALGVAQSRLGQLHEAKQSYEAAIKIDGNDWSTRYDYALCAEQFGNMLFAMREYERAIALNPSAWEPYANLGRLYVKGGQRGKGIEILERGLKARPNQPDLVYALAHALALEGRDDDARERLEQFLLVAPATDPRVEVAKRGLGDGS